MPALDPQDALSGDSMPVFDDGRPVPLARTALRAFGWNTAALLVLAAAQMLYTAVTSRALPASAFGIYAVGQALASIAGYFSLSALGSAVMRHPDENREPTLFGTAALAASLAGLLCGGLVFGAAELWAALWHLHAATDLVRLEAIPVGLAPPMSALLGLLRRRLRYRAAAMSELIGNLLGFAAGLVLVFALRDPRALVLAQGTAAAVTMLLAWVWLRPSHLRFDVSLARDLSRFGAQVGSQNVVYYAIYNAPSFAVSWLFGAATLGLYSRANVLIALPLTYGTQALSRALYPLMGRLSNDADRERRAITDVLVAASLVSFVFFASIAAAAGPIVHLLLGTHFLGAIPIVRWFALFGAINALVAIAGVVQEVRRWMRDVWKVQAGKLLFLLLGLPVVAFALKSVTAVLVVFCGSQVVGHAMQLMALRARGTIRLRPVLAAYSHHGAIAGVAYLALYFANVHMESQPVVALALDAGILLLIGLGLWIAPVEAPGIAALGERGILRRRPGTNPGG